MGRENFNETEIELKITLVQTKGGGLSIKRIAKHISNSLFNLAGEDRGSSRRNSSSNEDRGPSRNNSRSSEDASSEDRRSSPRRGYTRSSEDNCRGGRSGGED